jgi:predicted N-acyltransferase
MAGLSELRTQSRSHSLHVLFHTEEEGALLELLPGRIPRTTQQLHWESPGLGDFEAWLGTFRHKERKEVRRERRRPAELGVVVREHAGTELGPEEWAALECFYRDTVGRKGGEAYLSPEFFQIAAQRLSPFCRALLACAEGRYVAGALFFQRGRHLYGRYWGCLPGFESLHFELCYHRPIERCLAEGWTRFEAGAQGDHKLKRGLMPAPIRSSHWLAHAGLAAAVQQATLREGQSMERHMAQMAAHGPFRRGESR